MRLFSRVRTLAVAVVAPALLGGCMMSDGAYGGLSVGAGNYGYDGYGYPHGYDPYGGYYGGPGYGWYDGYYYPGNGYYVYDRAGRAYRMRAQDQAYWQSRREARAERRMDRLERREARAERRLNRMAENGAVRQRQSRSYDGTFGRGASRAVERAVRSREGAAAEQNVRDE